MKLFVLLFGIVIYTGAVFADENAVEQKVTERKTCAEIATEIANLNAIENPDEATQETLKQLQNMQRHSCVIKNTGRRAMGRLPVIVSPKDADDITVATSDALSQYLADKKANCEKLNYEIAKLATNTGDGTSDILASMRGVYEMDCVEKTESKPVEPIKSEQEIADEIDANLAAGLCGDGTKPNKYGCCTGEAFKDVGNLVFACCPKDGGLCFPPIK